MGKLQIIYEYDTDSPDDMYMYGNLTNANSYRRLLSEIFRELRSKSKYGKVGSGSWYKAYDLIWKLANEEGLNPWEEIF